MKVLLVISLFLGMSFLTYLFLPVRIEKKKKTLVLGLIFYTTFITGSVWYGNFIDQNKNLVKISKTSVKVIKKEPAKEDNMEHEDYPVFVTWETEPQEPKLREVFNLKLKIINQTEEDIDRFKLRFSENRFLKYFSISSVKPEVSISGQDVHFAKIPAQEEVEFVFQMIPKMQGMYEEQLILYNGEKPILINGKDLVFSMQMKI